MSNTWARVKDAVQSARQTGMEVQSVAVGRDLWDAVLAEILAETRFSVGQERREMGVAYCSFVWDGILVSKAFGAGTVEIHGSHVHRWSEAA